MDKKIVVVTGGNRGIGKETCRQLGILGHTVILTGRDLASAETAADEMSGDVHAYKLDVRNDNSAWNLGEKLRKEFGRIDALINNAGITGKSKMHQFQLDEMETVMNTNFYGPMRVSKALLPLLKASASPRIINISSGMGAISSLAEGGMATYRMSKTSLNAFTILLAAEMKEENIKVNAMCPGWVRTDMGGLTAPRSVKEGADTAVWLATEDSVPSGKFFRDRQEIPW